MNRVFDDELSERIATAADSLAASGAAQTRELFAQLYEPLHRLAKARMAQLPANQTLQATALVHEAFVRVSGRRGRDWGARHYFIGAVCKAMREILVDEGRKKRAAKRGGDLQREPGSNVAELAGDGPPDDVVALDEAMRRLAEDYPRHERVVELRYFGGLTEPQVADVLGVSTSTVERDWRFARSWLRRELRGSTPSEDPG